MATLKVTDVPVTVKPTKEWNAKIRPRNNSYYRLKFAAELVPILDSIIHSRTGKHIECVGGINPHSLNIQICQGWRYLIDYPAKVLQAIHYPVINTERFEKLRALCCIQELSGACAIIYTPTSETRAWSRRSTSNERLIDISQEGTKALAASKEIKWDMKITRWLTTPQLQAEPLILKDLTLDDAEVTKVNQALDRLKDTIDYTVTPNQIEIKLRV